MSKRIMVGLTKGLLLIAAIPLVLTALFVVINLTDEDLTPEAIAALRVPPEITPSAENGYIHFLGMDAPEGIAAYEWGVKVLGAYRSASQPGFVRDQNWENTVGTVRHRVKDNAKWCVVDEGMSCLSILNKNPDILSLLKQHALFINRYDEVRRQPVFKEIYFEAGPKAPTSPFHRLVSGQNLSLLKATELVSAGDIEAALTEIETEIAFHRRALSGMNSLSQKSRALRMLQNDVIYLSGLLRDVSESLLPHKAKIAAMLAPLSADESDLKAASADSLRYQVSLIPQNKFPLGAFLSSYGSEFGPKAFYEWAGYRPQSTINLLTSILLIEAGLADTPISEIDKRIESNQARYAEITEPGKWHFLNRTGFEVLGLFLGNQLLRTIFHVQDTQGLMSLVALQNELNGSTRHETSVSSILQGDPGMKRADPYTGLPMDFNAKTGTLSFAPRGDSLKGLKARFGGRIAMRL